MKYVFTTLSIGENHTRDYTLRLLNDVITKTEQDILVVTDVPDLIRNTFSSNRIKFNVLDRSKIKIRLWVNQPHSSSDFNFNLKYHCFEPLVGTNYDYVIFTDCDNSIEWFNVKEADEYFTTHLNAGYDSFGCRASWKLKGVIDEYFAQDNPYHGLFHHKILNYKLTKDLSEEYQKSPLPAEHVLAFQNSFKLEKFYLNWKDFHDKLCSLDYTYGTWAEGFEIGVSATLAGYNMCDITWHSTLLHKIVQYNTYKKLVGGHVSAFD